MITKLVGFKSSDGKLHTTIEEAQRAELDILLESPLSTDSILRNKDKIIDILTMKSNSLPRARRVNGGTKKRKSTPPSDALPFPPENKEAS